MTNALNHPALRLGNKHQLKSRNWGQILAEVNDFKTFADNVRSFAKQHVKTLGLDEQQTADAYAVLVGDIFEVFGEYFFQNKETDDRFFIKNYQLREDVQDNGIDAYAEDSRDSRPVFIQYKFYQEHETLKGHESHLTSFMTEVLNTFIDMADKNPQNYKFTSFPRMVVVTSCKGLHEYTARFQGRNLKVYNFDDLCQVCQQNTAFWTGFYQAVGAR